MMEATDADAGQTQNVSINGSPATRLSGVTDGPSTKNVDAVDRVYVNLKLDELQPHLLSLILMNLYKPLWRSDQFQE